MKTITAYFLFLIALAVFPASQSHAGGVPGKGDAPKENASLARRIRSVSTSIALFTAAMKATSKNARRWRPLSTWSTTMAPSSRAIPTHPAIPLSKSSATKNSLQRPAHRYTDRLGTRIQAIHGPIPQSSCLAGAYGFASLRRCGSRAELTRVLMEVVTFTPALNDADNEDDE